MAITHITVAQALAYENDPSTLPIGVEFDIVDSASNIESLTAAEILLLPDLGIHDIASNNASVVLTPIQAEAMVNGFVTIAAPTGDTVTTAAVTYNLTAAQLVALTASQIAAIAAAGYTTISVTDAGSPIISIGQADALLNAELTITVQPGNSVGFGDSAANIQALTQAQVTELYDFSAASLGVFGGSLMVTGGALALSLGQIVDLDENQFKMSLAGGATVAVQDTPTTLEALSASQIDEIGQFDRDIGSDRFSTIDLSGGVTLSTAQALALQADSLTVTVPHNDTVSLADSASNIQALSATQIASLSTFAAAEGVGVLAADGSVTFTSIDQILALEAASFSVTAPSGDSVSLSVTAAAVEALSTTELQSLPIDLIAVSDKSVTFTLAQVLALESDPAGVSVTVPSGDSVTLDTTATALEALTPTQWTGLGPLGITNINVSDASVVVNASEAVALEQTKSGTPINISVPNNDSVSLVDTAGDIARLTPAEVVKIGFVGVTSIVATGILPVSVSYYDNDLFGTPSNAPPPFTSFGISDIAANIETLTPAQIAAMPTAGVYSITATDASLVLTAAQAVALENAHIILNVPKNDSITVVDTAASNCPG